MVFAQGMQEAMRTAEAFADDAEAAAFWAADAQHVDTEDFTYIGAAGQVQAARRYAGQGDPLIVYFHGGGWAGGSIAINEPACQRLAHLTGFEVVSLSYRLAPAHSFPAGLEDCRAGLRALRGSRPVVLAGASAGANLATALALDAQVQGLVSFYGVFGADLTTDSHRRFATGYGFTSARMADLFALYDPEGRRHSDPRLCPLVASDTQLAALPPALLIAAELDVLSDDTRALAARLGALSLPHTLHIEPGVTHGFINRGRLVPAAKACLARAARFIQDRDYS